MKFLLTFILIVVYEAVICQVKVPQSWFHEELLNNPRKYAAEFNSLISYTETGQFRNVMTGNAVLLKNSYASAEIINPEAWKPSVEGRTVSSVDIVFTRYPLKKEDWLTNYYQLLADRLKALFKIDPSLNDNRIKFRMVVQTDCLTDMEARKFFHGIIIYYSDSKSNKPSAIYQKRDDITKYRLSKIKSEKENNDSLQPDLFRFYEDQLPVDSSRKQTKTRKVKGKCPDFSKDPGRF
ncbi:MAG: hypothetical protein NTW49_05355 [Bacteroidia bacterium]|nr:hypothetical protein [Bacteroidia bacterium]